MECEWRKKPPGITGQFIGLIVLHLMSDPLNPMLPVQSIIICHLAPSNLWQLQGQHLTELWYQAGAFSSCNGSWPIRLTNKNKTKAVAGRQKTCGCPWLRKPRGQRLVRSKVRDQTCGDDIVKKLLCHSCLSAPGREAWDKSSPLGRHICCWVCNH